MASSASSPEMGAGGLFVQKLLDAQAVDLAHDEVEVGHPLGALLLRQVDVLVEFPQNAQQGVVGGQVQTQRLPHAAVVFTHADFSLWFVCIRQENGALASAPPGSAHPPYFLNTVIR